MKSSSEVTAAVIEGDHRTGNDGKGYYIRTFTGKKFFWNDIENNPFDIRDIAHSLSMNCRWTGHVRSFYPVGQHSIYASWEAQDMGLSFDDQLAALLHDATEAYVHDTPSPLKWHLREHDFTAFADLEKRIDVAIFKTFNLPYPRNPVIKQIDLRLLSTENRDLMPLGEERMHMIEPYDWHVQPLDCQTVEKSFLKRFDALQEKRNAQPTNS